MSMKQIVASDLRPGNLVHFEKPVRPHIGEINTRKNICKLSSFGIHLIDTDPKTKVKPIKLTTEYLDGAKFRKGNIWYRELDLDKRLNLTVGPDGYFYPSLEQLGEMAHEGLNIVCLERIEAVHELQNLWHTLKHEELEFKI